MSLTSTPRELPGVVGSLVYTFFMAASSRRGSVTFKYLVPSSVVVIFV